MIKAAKENTNMKVKTGGDAQNIQEMFKDQPNGWIQWKGTDVCIDIYCECGEQSHYDGKFMYGIKCPHCKREYHVNPHIQLIEVEHYEYPTMQKAFK